MKNFKLLLVFLFIFAFALFGCEKSNENNDNKDANVYEVKFIDDGVVAHVEKVNKNESVKPYEVSSLLHEFIGWYNNDTLFDFETKINSNLELVSKYTKTVTFKNYDGTILKKVEVKEGDKIVAPENPNNYSDGDYDYEFKSWDKELIGVNTDLVITATFNSKIRMINVTFYDINGVKLDTIEVEKGSTVDPYNYKDVKDNYYNYEIKGWKTNLESTDMFDFGSKIKENCDLYPVTYRTPIPQSLKWKKLSIMGDSVSTFYKKGDNVSSYYTGTNQYYYPMYCSSVDSSDKTYWMQLINKTHMNLGVNESYSGTTCYGTGDTVGCSQTRVDHLGLNGDPDIIITFLGINDNCSGYTEAQFRSAYNSMLSKIEAKYPHAYIMVVKLPYSNYHLNQPTNHAKYSEETRVIYNKVLDELIEQHQVGVVNLDEAQTVDTWKTILNDNLHPSYNGMKIWADQFYKDFMKYFGQATN